MTLKVPVVAALCSLWLLAGPAFARDGGQSVRLRDECDPATFNAGARPLCNPALSGDVTLQQLTAFLSQQPQDILRKRDALGWKFNPDDTEVRVGTTLQISNIGGETHTFTDVSASGFTGGCIAGLNAPFGLAPNPLCANFAQVQATSGVPSGGSLSVRLTRVGTVLFECLIHPWMRTSVRVRSN
jgi:plastocyanin